MRKITQSWGLHTLLQMAHRYDIFIEVVVIRKREFLMPYNNFF